MEFTQYVEQLRAGQQVQFPPKAHTLDYARSLDAQDPIKLRDQYIIPTQASLKKKALDGKIPSIANGHANGLTDGLANGDAKHEDEDSTPGVYFCGNSLGLQAKAVRQHIDAQLETWASIAVHGHFNKLENSPLACWQDMAADCAAHFADIVGASPEEIVVMNTLTVNLHLLMASFYRPTEKRHKIILEWKPFPSDWYAIESHIRWHGLDPARSMVPLHPDNEAGGDAYISTERVLAAIDEHAEETALIMLPGLQYYSGQLFDMPRITAHARSKGIVVGWDLAHAAGNVELRLHDWDVDFAAWCTYKYLNAGPGAIAGAFVHERHGKVVPAADGKGFEFRDRLSGWYGNDKTSRFNMAKEFQPTPGAGGFQLSNPSAVDLASLRGALSVFEKTSISKLRSKSLVLTAYAEYLLDRILEEDRQNGAEASFKVLTPRNPMERGAQLSVLLKAGLLDKVVDTLAEAGVVCDKRKPDVIRVAPVPMYNTFEDVWRCIEAIKKGARA
ncbi:uncharacterized protein E0L32_003390 [Thyridium curvatum]|uniref:Kynureninase n=1 Tax=Thyridium curvatum TaxID=1093900 RepID=A0A507BJH0_9PEZI|nr:uncharacterized protein E0L32_003390 [Thyridium curvatum]TPX16828.1 hypothetical protein E0L32_003390 [Thyridium curvatum]